MLDLFYFDTGYGSMQKGTGDSISTRLTIGVSKF